MHLDAGYDSDKTRAVLDERGLHSRIAHKGEKGPIPASQRWHAERTHAWQSAFYRLTRCYERRATVVDAFFDLADAIITVRSPIRRAWTTHRWDERPNRRPRPHSCPCHLYMSRTASSSTAAPDDSSSGAAAERRGSAR